MKDISELKDLVKGIITVAKSVKNGLEDDGKIDLAEGFKIGVTTVREGIKVDFKELPAEYKDLDTEEKKELYLLIMDELGLDGSKIQDRKVEGFVDILLGLFK